jgi:ribosome maturation factor RimP
MTLDDLIDPVRRQLAELGFELVDLRRSGSTEHPLLQVRIDRPDSSPGHGVTAEDCVRTSRALERFLETRTAAGPRYGLQVSSPGLERPVVYPDHWRRFAGREVRIRGRHSARSPAVIVAVPDDATVTLRFRDGTEEAVPFREIKDATLVYHWPAKP